MGLVPRKPVSGCANIKATDQPASPCSLISAIVNLLFESKYILTFYKQILWIASEAQQAGLGIIWLETPKLGFLHRIVAHIV